MRMSIDYSSVGITKWGECGGGVKGKRAFLKESCAKNFILRQPDFVADMI